MIPSRSIMDDEEGESSSPCSNAALPMRSGVVSSFFPALFLVAHRQRRNERALADDVGI